MVDIIEKRDEKCSSHHQAHEKFPMFSITERTQTENKANGHAIDPNLSNQFIVHEFRRQPLLLNIAPVDGTLPQLAEELWR